MLDIVYEQTTHKTGGHTIDEYRAKSISSIRKQSILCMSILRAESDKSESLYNDMQLLLDLLALLINILKWNQKEFQTPKSKRPLIPGKRD
jgi:hypothetical protein